MAEIEDREAHEMRAGSEPSRDLGVADALALAEHAHAGATDKAGRPYINHVRRVMRDVATDDEKIVAALHDVVEDTPLTLSELADMGWPAAVVEAIDALTRRADEPYGAFIDRVAASPLARAVKIADLIDNSDEARLRLLERSEADRLREKYRRAIATLGATEEVASRREARLLSEAVENVILDPTLPIDDLALQASIDAVVRCDACPRTARRLLRLGETLFLDGFMGRASWVLHAQPNIRDPADLAALDAALRALDSEALFEMDCEYVPWWCPECRLPYCDHHWMMDTVFDDGFYDCTYGTCPAGHVRLLRD